MTTTSKQDHDFLSEIMGNSALETAIEFIKQNFQPEDIFGENALLEFAANYDPEIVFEKSIGDLESWAERNGYIKE